MSDSALLTSIYGKKAEERMESEESECAAEQGVSKGGRGERGGGEMIENRRAKRERRERA